MAGGSGDALLERCNISRSHPIALHTQQPSAQTPGKQLGNSLEVDGTDVLSAANVVVICAVTELFGVDLSSSSLCINFSA